MQYLKLEGSASIFPVKYFVFDKVKYRFLKISDTFSSICKSSASQYINKYKIKRNINDLFVQTLAIQIQSKDGHLHVSYFSSLRHVATLLKR